MFRHKLFKGVVNDEGVIVTLHFPGKIRYRNEKSTTIYFEMLTESEYDITVSKDSITKWDDGDEIDSTERDRIAENIRQALLVIKCRADIGQPLDNLAEKPEETRGPFQ